MDVERFIWAPEVHDSYRESCFYYLISGREEGSVKAFHQVIAETLINSRAGGFCLYVLYGEFDALLRAWATDELRKRFLRALADSGRILDIVEFRADEALYYYGQAPLTVAPSEIRRLEPLIIDVAEAQRRDAWSAEAISAYNNLKERGAILTPPGKVDGSAKFYMFFRESSPGRSAAADQIRARLVQAAQEADAEAIAFYSGAGFCDYILKCTASSYDAVLGIVELVRSAALDFRLRPVTAVIANYPTAREVETLDSVLDGLDETVEELVTLLEDPAIRSEVGALPGADREVLERLYRAHRSTLLDPVAGPDALDIIRYSILNDLRNLNRALAFLTDIEGEVRRLVTRAGPLLGDRWLAQVRTCSSRIGVSSEDGDRGDIAELPPIKWSLRQLLEVLRFVVDEFPPVGERVRPILPANWISHIRDTLELRNDRAHSKILNGVDLRHFSGEWGEKLDKILTASDFYVALGRANREIDQVHAHAEPA